MGNYDLSKLTEITQSGWTGDFYLPKDVMQANGIYNPLVCEDYDSDVALYAMLTELVSGWTRDESEDGGVIIYTKPKANNG